MVATSLDGHKKSQIISNNCNGKSNHHATAENNKPKAKSSHEKSRYILILRKSGRLTQMPKEVALKISVLARTSTKAKRSILLGKRGMESIKFANIPRQKLKKNAPHEPHIGYGYVINISSKTLSTAQTSLFSSH